MEAELCFRMSRAQVSLLSGHAPVGSAVQAPVIIYGQGWVPYAMGGISVSPLGMGQTELVIVRIRSYDQLLAGI